MSSLLHNFFGIMHLVRTNYLSKGPVSVDIELSNRCNLRCKMCWFHGESGVGDRYRNSEITTVEVLELINQLAAYRPTLYFGGGEPFIREDFLEILSHANSLALSTGFTTNGTLLNQEKIEKITALGINAINFSIDGPEALHDKLRGEGNFKKAMSAIQSLLESKTRKKLKKPSIVVNITINPMVVGHLKETVDTIRDRTGNEIDFFRIHHLWFVTPKELQVHRKAVRESLEVSAPGSVSHCIPLSRQLDSVRLADEMAHLKNAGKIRFFPDIQGKEIRAYYSEGYRLTKRCLAPFRAALVKPNGDVKFCPDEWIDDYVLGNVRRDRFETIWNHAKAKHFRSVILRRKSFPACKRCSWMYCY
jgi:radical SAM protein with 4Fe4S-binding SPASM domain